MTSLLEHHRWIAFVKALGVLLVSEIGDKTFFLAAVLAMRNSRWTVFSGAFGALSTMTVLSAAMGWAAPALISQKYTHWAAVVLFVVFGLHTLYGAFKEDTDEKSDLQEVEEELDELEAKKASAKSGKSKDRAGAGSKFLEMLFSPVFLKAFSLTFVAEWGDRSQMTTIGLAASEDVYGVALGGILGQAICTGIAVICGRHLAAHINEKAMAIFGGLLFLAFAAHATYTGP